MATSPNTALCALDAAGSAIVVKTISDIDSRLNNPAWVKSWVCNEDKNPTWRMSFVGRLSAGEKAAITNAYRDAGWGTVKVSNSEDEGERPGLFGVTLSRD